MPGGLLEEGPLLERLGGDERADGALLDDEVLGLADGVFPELLLDVPEADGLAVEPVFALAGAEGAVGDGHLAVLAAQRQDDVGHADGRALGVAVEDDVVGPVAADGPLAVAAEHPEEGVDEVALARAVRADDGRDTGVEDDLGPVDEGLESLQFELLDDHIVCSRLDGGFRCGFPGFPVCSRADSRGSIIVNSALFGKRRRPPL